MPTAFAISHVAFEDLGSLEPVLREAGYSVSMVDASTADLGDSALLKSDLLVVLGGPIGVYEHEAYPFLAGELKLIHSRLAEKRATIGICLGAQLLASACGAAVYPGKRGKEIGWLPIQAGADAGLYPEFMTLLNSNQRVLHWHGDTFDLPANARHLAATDLYPNQAFAFERYALGLQFHLEITASSLERWYVGHTCELGGAKISVSQLRQESLLYAPKLEPAAKQFWREWLSRL